MEFSNEIALLQEIYKGSAMGEESIRQLLPKVENPSFRSDLKIQYQDYQALTKRAEEQLKSLGQCPREATGCQRAMLWTSLHGQTMMNSETSHLAEMMIQGSNMGIISLTKALNCYTASDEDGQESGTRARDIAEAMIQMEENNIERLKAYLQ